jgi:hypothetical protein
MLVTFTNASPEKKFVSQLYKSLEPGESLQVRRTQEELAADPGLVDLVNTSVITLAFVAEPQDSVFFGYMPPAPARTNATRGPANAYPAGHQIWNVGGALPVPQWADPVANLWRDSAGAPV